MTAWTKALPILSLFATFASTGVAEADDVIENLTFTGYAQCEGVLCAALGSHPVTGTYTLDVTTQTVVGTYSFPLPFATISSTDPGANTLVQPYLGHEDVFFYDYVPGLLLQEVLLFFDPSNLQQLGPLATNVTSYACIDTTGSSGLASCAPDYILYGSTALATPEPSSLVLLGTGLFGVIGAVRKRFA